jgi:SH3-like domain-containing protein
MTRPTPGIILIVTLLFVLVNVAVAADTVAITARQTVVRAGPDSKQRILATVPQGTTLALLERRQGWYKVLLDDGQEGWVAQSAAQVQDGRGFAVIPPIVRISGRSRIPATMPRTWQPRYGNWALP